MNHVYSNKVYPIIISLILIFISLQLAKIAIQGVFNTIYALSLIGILLILIRSKWEFVVFIYILFFPMGDIIPAGSILIPGIGIVEIISIILIVKYFLTYRRLDFNFDRTQKLAIILSFFFIVIYLNTFYIKHFFLYGLGGISSLTLSIRLVKFIIQFASIFIIISKIKNPDTYKWVKRGLITGFIFYGVSVFLTPIFYNIGLNIGGIKDFESAQGSLMEARAVGLFQGDSGYFAHFMAVGFGFFLSSLERKRNIINILGLLATFIAILITSSRAGFITLVLIIFIFTLQNLIRGKLLPVVIFPVLIVTFFFWEDYLLSRFYTLSEEVDTIEVINRVKFQMYYIHEMIQDPFKLLIGYWEKSSLYRWRVPHNQYLGMLFWGGIPYLVTFLVILYKIYKNGVTQHKVYRKISIIYPYIGFVVPYLFSPNEFIIYFPLILSIQQSIFSYKVRKV